MLKVTKTTGFLAMCTTCHGLAKEAVTTQQEAEKLAKMHVSLHSGHKSHLGHIVVVIPADLISSSV